jgi:hypothetical protein
MISYIDIKNRQQMGPYIPILERDTDTLSKQLFFSFSLHAFLMANVNPPASIVVSPAAAHNLC